MMPLTFFLNIRTWANALEPPMATGDPLSHAELGRMSLQQLADLPFPGAAGQSRPEAGIEPPAPRRFPTA